MNIFALDSAGKTAGVALWQDGTLLYESYLAVAGTHSETLLALCDAAFRACGLCPADVDLYALNAGPGSFTGLRIGMGIVKGLAFAADTPCAPVSTLAALAHAYPADGLLAAALDARRGEVYCALFRREGGKLLRLTEDAAMPATAFAALAASHRRNRATPTALTPCSDATALTDAAKATASDSACGTSIDESVVCTGDGAHLLCTGAQGFVLVPAPYRLGRANGICLAAEALLAQGACVPAAALSPEYLRLSQAERERAEKMKKENTKP